VLICPLGHKATECKANRVLDLSKIATKDPEEAWEMVKRADAEGDLDDFREVRFPVAESEEDSGTYNIHNLGSESVCQGRTLDYLCSVGELFSQKQDELLLDCKGMASKRVFQFYGRI